MSKEFNVKWNIRNLLRFTFPTILSMIFMGLYTAVDGLFISRYVGANAVAALNITFPLFSLTFGLSIMLTVGGATLVGIKLGEKKELEANKMYTQTFTYICLINIIISAIAVIFIDPILRLLGATDLIMDDARIYGLILMGASLFVGIKVFYEYFLRTENAAGYALVMSIVGGVINLILDYFLIVEMGMGIEGAAIGTVAGWIIPLLVVIHFYKYNDTMLKFKKTKLEFKFLKDISLNGISELVTEISTGITTFLFNLILIRSLGELGVAAIGIIMYISFIFNSFFFGLAMGTQPVISRYLGAKRIEEMSQVTRLTFKLIVVAGFLFLGLTYLVGPSLIRLFANNNGALFDIAQKALYYFAPAYMLMGINIFGSAFFTSVNDGKTSGLISTLRALVFVIIGLVTLPIFLGSKGIWLSVPFAEVVTLFFTVSLILRYWKKESSTINSKV
jgi:putative MATE family efflux protein